MTKEDLMKKAYVERDISWMYFNHRILQEAEKEYVPLLERLSFLGIYSNNLDEFFRVRVASLNRMLDQKLDKDTEQQIKKSLKTINKLNESYSKEYTEAVDTVFANLKFTRFACSPKTYSTMSRRSSLRSSSTTSSMVLSTLSGSTR